MVRSAVGWAQAPAAAGISAHTAIFSPGSGSFHCRGEFKEPMAVLKLPEPVAAGRGGSRVGGVVLLHPSEQHFHPFHDSWQLAASLWRSSVGHRDKMTAVNRFMQPIMEMQMWCSGPGDLVWVKRKYYLRLCLKKLTDHKLKATPHPADVT